MLLSRNVGSAQTTRIVLPNHDLHNHTIFSGHADDDATIANLVARANELHLDVLGLSEHLMREEDMDIYQAFQQEARRHLSDGTQILVGVEMDIDPMDPSGRWVAPAITCDYVILSAHGFPQFDLGLPESDLRLPLPIAKRRLAMRYLEWYGLAVAGGGMHILGHPLREAIKMGLIDLADEEMLEASVAVFRPAAEKGTAFELNEPLLEYLDSAGQLKDYINLIRRLRSIGMRFARGSDSHSIATVGASEMITRAAAAVGLSAADWIDPRSLLRR